MRVRPSSSVADPNFLRPNLGFTKVRRPSTLKELTRNISRKQRVFSVRGNLVGVRIGTLLMNHVTPTPTVL